MEKEKKDIKELAKECHEAVTSMGFKKLEMKDIPAHMIRTVTEIMYEAYDEISQPQKGNLAEELADVAISILRPLWELYEDDWELGDDDVFDRVSTNIIEDRVGCQDCRKIMFRLMAGTVVYHLGAAQQHWFREEFSDIRLSLGTALSSVFQMAEYFRIDLDKEISLKLQKLEDKKGTEPPQKDI